jgi:hypothetical protein
MIRRQIRFTADELAALERNAAERRISVSELVREAVDTNLAMRRTPPRDELISRSLAAMGRFSSRDGDVARRTTSTSPTQRRNERLCRRPGNRLPSCKVAYP